MQISLASLGSTNILHIVAKGMNHQVCIHILLDGIYSSAELWVPLLGLVANYSLLSCGSQLGQGLIHAAIGRFRLLASKRGGILLISLASLGATNILHIVAKWASHQVCIHILLDGIYSSAELWVSLLGRVANYSLLITAC